MEEVGAPAEMLELYSSNGLIWPERIKFIREANACEHISADQP